MRQIIYFMKQLHRFSGPVIYINQLGMAIMSLLSGFSVFLVIPLISLTGLTNLTNLTMVTFTPLSKMSNWLRLLSPNIDLLLILIIYVVLMIGQSIFQNKQTLLNIKIQQKFIRYLKEETYKAILESDWKFFIRNRKSDLTNSMLMEINRVGAGTHFFLEFISSSIFTLVQIGFALYISTKMTLFVIFFGSLLLVFSKSFIKRSNNLGTDMVELSREYLAGITEQINGIKDIKSNSLERTYIDWLKRISIKIEKNTVNMVKVKNSSQLIYKFASTLIVALFLFISIITFKTQPTQLLLILVIISRLWPRITTIQSDLEQLSSNIPSFNALIQLQKECQESKEIRSKDLIENVSPVILESGIETRNVFFSYDIEKNQYALNDINIIIPANRMTAIVGHSGAGKSTLIDLIMGLNKPQKGEFFVDGKQLNDRNLLGLRKSISYVPQDSFVFNSSIRDNLKIVHSEATDGELWKALQFAAADYFVDKLPQKLDTIVGDRGIKLSGGERQRLVLARAILKQPSILILDEATSALDTENEAIIQDAIERIRGKMTLIVIAHRLSTIRNADQVIVLDEGKVVQQGGYAQLSRDKRGVFGQLLEKQVQTTS